jgi:hypothetical protein
LSSLITCHVSPRERAGASSSTTRPAKSDILSMFVVHSLEDCFPVLEHQSLAPREFADGIFR